MKRLLSPAFFALVVGAFFLPFVTISCSSEALQGLQGLGGEQGQAGQTPEFKIEATGWNLVTGSEPKGAESFEQLGQQFGGGEGQPDAGGEPSMFAIAAFAAAILGFLLSFLPRTAGGISAAVLAGVGAISLFLLRNDISGDLPSEAGAFISVEYQLGYWLALLFFLLALGAGIWRAMSERRLAATPDAYGSGMGAPPPPGGAMGGTTPPPPGGTMGGEPPTAPPPGGTPTA